MSRGRRYDGEQKLNIKKVIATLLFFVVLVMIIFFVIKFFKNGKTSAKQKNITNSYISVYTDGKWGVINSKGEYVINPTYENMIVIPDSSKEIFICQKDVDLEKGTFTSYAINSKSSKLFEKYDTVEAIQRIDSENIVKFDSNVLKVSKDGKYGLINFTGTELLECSYEKIEPIKYIKNSFITEKDGKKGVVDNSGNVIIENKYKDISSLTEKYEDGYIVKDDNNKYGVINYNKKQVLECKYDKIENIYGNGMYVVKSGNEVQVINTEGKVILNKGFDQIISLDTNILIKKSNKYGVVSNEGEELLKAEYDDLKYLYSGNYIAKKDNKYGVINTLGEVILDFKYEKIQYMNEEGFIEAEIDYSNTELMDTNFNVKCTGIVSEINTNYKYVKVRQQEGYKYYNFKLEEKQIQEIYPANTLFLSKQNGKYGFVNKNGIVVVDYIYDDATEQNEYGYAAIKKDGKWGAIDSVGNIAVEPKYEMMNNPVISFIGKWHLGPDLNANYYTDIME